MHSRDLATKLERLIAIPLLLIGATALIGCSAETGVVPSSKETVRNYFQQEEKATAELKGRAAQAEAKIKNIKGKLIGRSQTD